ncbi:5-hydroxytryptamine receptor 3A-like isoform X2 [Dendropsophus ebraccatus]|uniref:5-hydroxytryptamine receptor 3A-like isoform X2 n=1 Tax=Dendropsophus ebraccatus TaxID=150705 RepID=UPI0038316ADB
MRYYIPGAVLKQTCKHYDVINYLNITERQDLLLMTMPKNDWKEPLVVTVDMLFVSILNVVEKTQTLMTYFWIFTIWKNDFLSWDPEQFCNISYVTIPLSSVWVPDLYFLEQVVEDISPWMKYANLTHDGVITALKPMRLTSTCVLEFYYFPFDIQKCSVIFTSTMHRENHIILRTLRNTTEIRKEDIDLYVENGEWNPLEITVEEKQLNGYSTLFCTLVMKRQSSLYVSALILPSLSLMVLDLLSHFIPRAYNEKISFKITVLLGISVLTIILNDLLPASSGTPPVIVIFVIGTMTLIAAGTVELILIMYIGGKILKPDTKTAGAFPPYQGPLPQSCSREVQFEDEGTVLEDGVLSKLERICRDIQLVRQQILTLRSTEEMEEKCAKFQDKIENVVFYLHFLLVSAFYAIVFVLWKW